MKEIKMTFRRRMDYEHRLYEELIVYEEKTIVATCNKERPIDFIFPHAMLGEGWFLHKIEHIYFDDGEINDSKINEYL